jgi:hypothetical protein
MRLSHFFLMPSLVVCKSTWKVWMESKVQCMWELDVCLEGELYMGIIHQPKKEIRRQFKIFFVVLTNPQRKTILHMLQIRKRRPIPSILSLVLKTLKKASRVSKLITFKWYQKFHIVLIFNAINFMVFSQGITCSYIRSLHGNFQG